MLNNRSLEVCWLCLFQTVWKSKLQNWSIFIAFLCPFYTSKETWVYLFWAVCLISSSLMSNKRVGYMMSIVAKAAWNKYNHCCPELWVLVVFTDFCWRYSMLLYWKTIYVCLKVQIFWKNEIWSFSPPHSVFPFLDPVHSQFSFSVWGEISNWVGLFLLSWFLTQDHFFIFIYFWTLGRTRPIFWH